MSITIRDVAKAAGVSVTTAHRGLNGKGELGAATRDRVLAAARELNYVPSAAARTLVSGKSNTIGMIINDNSSSVYAGIVRGVEQAANAAGFGLLLCNSADEQSKALSCLSLFRRMQVDGILITPVQTDNQDIAYLRGSGIPFVLLLRHFDDPRDDIVVIDNEAGGYAATRHLLDLGHRRIGHVSGPPHVSSARGRRNGYERALAEEGLAVDVSLVRAGPFTVDGGYRAALDILGLPDPPEAIFAANDLLAVGVMKAARELGMSIPGVLALVGGDNIELAEFLETPLTTFHQPALDIGRRGAELLLSRLQGEASPPRRIVLAPELIPRKSAGERV